MQKELTRFYEDTHSYYNGEKKYISVTTLIGNYEDKFDGEIMSWYCAIKEIHIKEYGERNWLDKYRGAKKRFIYNGKPKADYIYLYLGQIAKSNVNLHSKISIRRVELLNKWETEGKIASELGSARHKEKEEAIYNTGVKKAFAEKLDKKGYYKEAIDLFTVTDGIKPELLVDNHQFEIAGQVDHPVFETIDGTQYVNIYDYKTNDGGVKIEAFGNKKLKYPLDNLPHSKFYIYAMQLSTYAYMLEFYGKVPRELKLIEVNRETGEEGLNLPVPYLREEVIKMFNHYSDTVTNKEVKKQDSEMFYF